MESIHVAHFTPHQLSLPFCCLVLIPLHLFLALRSHPPSFILYVAGPFSPNCHSIPTQSTQTYTICVQK